MPTSVIVRSANGHFSSYAIVSVVVALSGFLCCTHGEAMPCFRFHGDESGCVAATIEGTSKGTCWYDRDGSWCVTQPCMSLGGTSRTTCVSIGEMCTYSLNDRICLDAPCEGMSVQKCQSAYACVWNASGLGSCRARKCEESDALHCPQQYCAVTGAACVNAPCESFVAPSSCVEWSNRRCQWLLGSCLAVECTTSDNASVCNAATHAKCLWISDNTDDSSRGFCLEEHALADAPCSQLSYLAQACWRALPTLRCRVAVPASNWSDVTCVENSVAGGSKMCNLYPSVDCLQDARCNLVSVSPFVDASKCVSLVCGSIYSQELCVRQGCIWSDAASTCEDAALSRYSDAWNMERFALVAPQLRACETFRAAECPMERCVAEQAGVLGCTAPNNIAFQALLTSVSANNTCVTCEVQLCQCMGTKFNGAFLRNFTVPVQGGLGLCDMLPVIPSGNCTSGAFAEKVQQCTADYIHCKIRLASEAAQELDATKSCTSWARALRLQLLDAAATVDMDAGNWSIVKTGLYSACLRGAALIRTEALSWVPLQNGSCQAHIFNVTQVCVSTLAPHVAALYERRVPTDPALTFNFTVSTAAVTALLDEYDAPPQANNESLASYFASHYFPIVEAELHNLLMEAACYFSRDSCLTDWRVELVANFSSPSAAAHLRSTDAVFSIVVGAVCRCNASAVEQLKKYVAAMADWSCMPENAVRPRIFEELGLANSSHQDPLRVVLWVSAAGDALSAPQEETSGLALWVLFTVIVGCGLAGVLIGSLTALFVLRPPEVPSVRERLLDAPFLSHDKDL